jgi:hypothetical protein
LIGIYPKVDVKGCPAGDLIATPASLTFERLIYFKIARIIRAAYGDRKRTLSKRFSKLFFRLSKLGFCLSSARPFPEES